MITPWKANLLNPSSAMSLRSRQLSEYIRREISETVDQRITFARFMELSLYTPSLGYYMESATILGAQGDFVTAPEISPLFSRCLAYYCHSILKTLSSSGRTVIEIGGGTGRMAADLLLTLEQLDCLPGHYILVEISDHLRIQQQRNLQQWIPHLVDRVSYLSHLPINQPIQGIILANEVIDALPVHIFQLNQEGLQERYVTVEKDKFVWSTGEFSTIALSKKVKKIQESYLEKVVYYQSEVNIALERWLATLKGCLQQGCMIFIDYGWIEREYYHFQRIQGTLACYYQHARYEDPLERMGMQDITAHVNFTQVAEIAHVLGLQVEAFVPQAAFLLACGLLELESLCYNHLTFLKKKGDLHQLLSPNEMGELCKVMVLSHNFQGSLLPLDEYDRRGWL